MIGHVPSRCHDPESLPGCTPARPAFGRQRLLAAVTPVGIDGQIRVSPREHEVRGVADCHGFGEGDLPDQRVGIGHLTGRVQALD